MRWALGAPRGLAPDESFHNTMNSAANRDPDVTPRTSYKITCWGRVQAPGGPCGVGDSAFQEVFYPRTRALLQNPRALGAAGLPTASCSALGASHTARPLLFRSSAGGSLTPTPCWPRSSGAPGGPRHRKLYHLPQWGALPGAFRCLPTSGRPTRHCPSVWGAVWT